MTPSGATLHYFVGDPDEFNTIDLRKFEGDATSGLHTHAVLRDVVELAANQIRQSWCRSVCSYFVDDPDERVVRTILIDLQKALSGL